MSTAIVVIVVVCVLIVVGAIAFALWQYRQRRRTQQLQEQFGPEYDRAVSDHGKSAESVLEDRREKVEQYDIRGLSPEEKARFTDQWQAVQADFVDHPVQAIESADELIRDLMSTVGYRAGTFDQREEAASVRYPDVVQNYRTAHQLAQGQDGGEATTEDLREAMVLYRSLFERVAGTTEEASVSSNS